MLTKTLFTDKIFRFYYLKTYNNSEFEDFNDLPDKEKIKFLINLFLFVSKKRENSNSNNGDNFFQNFGSRYYTTIQKTENMKETEGNFSPKFTNQKHSLTYNAVNNNIDSYVNRKTSFSFHNMARLSFNTVTLNNQERTETLEVSEIKDNFKNILLKYSQIPKLNCSTELNTKELQGLMNNIENTIIKGSSVFDNYIKENNETINTTMLNTRNAVKLCETQKLNEVLLYSSFHNYQSTFHKGDYNKSLKIKQKPDKLTLLDENYYIFDNIEIFMDYPHVTKGILESESNGLLSCSNDTKFKKLRNKNKRCDVDSVNFVLFNTCNSNLMMNPSKSNFIKRTAFDKKPRSFVKDLVISIDTITEQTELNNSKCNKKNYDCDDIVEKIYFCPDNLKASFDTNDLNKVGILLLDYTRMESDYENFKKLSQVKFLELNQKIEEDAKIFGEERENFYKEINYIKEKEQKKFDLVYEYVNMLRGKLEFCQKLTKYEDNFELDESKLAEAITRNLDFLSRSEIKFTKDKENQNLSDFNINFNILTNLDIRDDDEMSHSTSIRSADNFSKLIQNNKSKKN